MRLIGNLVECHNILLVLALQDHWRTTLQWRSWRCGIGWSRRGRRWSSSSRSSTSFTASLNSSKWLQVGLNKSAGLNFFSVAIRDFHTFVLSKILVRRTLGIFGSKAEAYPSRAPYGAHTILRLLALFSIISLTRNSLPRLMPKGDNVL